MSRLQNKILNKFEQLSFITKSFRLLFQYLKSYSIILGLIISFIYVSCSHSINKKEKKIKDNEKKLSQLEVSSNGRFLITESGHPVFLNSGTAWMIHYKLDTSEVNYYFKKRKEQKFNCVAISAFRVKGRLVNVYGHEPFRRANNSDLFDPLSPFIISEYDFWDHLDYVIDKAEELNFYVILLPSWGTQVAGSWDGSDTSGIIFNEDNAYQYGQWLGNRYSKKKHIIWMMGGDVSAIYGKKDYRDVFRGMAKGIADGVYGEDNKNGDTDYSTILMSYHPRKYHPNSSEWFHNNEWLDFNSIQDWPEDQIDAVIKDYQLEPVKPTWLFEGRYEDYREEWKDWQVRYQAYQTVFAGGFGHTYGHESLIGNFIPGWKNKMDDPGAWQMQHLYSLMTSMNKEEFLNRIPNQNLLIGDQGTAERLTSTRIQATQGSEGNYAFIYSANGRDINVKMALLAKSKMDAYWYNPRNGKWHVNGVEYASPVPFEKNVVSGLGAPSKLFDPPGSPENENDWVLVLR